MAINRGTRRETFLHLFEACAVLGVIGGVALGLYQGWGKPIPAFWTSVFQISFIGFIAGSVVGLILGTLAAVIKTIFG